MMSPPQKELIAQARGILADLTEHLHHEVELEQPQAESSTPDALLRAGGAIFVLECRVATSTAALYQAIRTVKAHGSRTRALGFAAEVVPVLAVPFMGPTGRALCDEESCSWLDLSGNANIRAPGLLVRIEGNPNLFKRRGRPASAFSPMASRITRVLLTYPTVDSSQRQLAQRTGIDEGYISRIVRNLVDQGLVGKYGNLIRVPDPDLLLRAWLDDYDFAKHRCIAGHIPARDGDELVRRLAGALAHQPHQPAYAATGLAAAWCMGRYAAFRTASIYVHSEDALDDLRDLSFRPTDRGANVWMLVPADAGVFQGVVTTKDGVHCVAPVQVYLDLHAHSERARDVALEFRRHHLNWGKSQ